MAKGRGYSGAYRDSKDRLRPITPRKRSKAKTGVPISIKARNPRVNGRLPKGASMSDIITIEGVSKTRRAWLTDLSLETKINYSSPTQAWRLDHNRTDTIHIDNPESSRRKKRLREGGGKKKRTAKKAPKKPPKSRKKEGVGTIEYDGAVWKWDYQRKEWMLANYGGTLKGKTKKKAKKETRKELELRYIKEYKRVNDTWEGVNIDKMRSLSDSELRKSTTSLSKKEPAKKKPSKPKVKSEKPVTNTYEFYSDPSHGWIKVPIRDLKALGIEGDISPYSYKREGYAYLEEDADATLFMKALKSKGIDVKFNEHHTNKRSRIRGYDQFPSSASKSSRPIPKTYYGSHMVGERKVNAVLQGFYPDSVYHNFDLTSVRSNKDWRAFLSKHGFRSVGGVDPDAKRSGRVPRHVYRNPDGVILVTSAESRVSMLTPDGKGGMKAVQTKEHNLGYVRFEFSKKDRAKLKPILKDFRGDRQLTFTQRDGGQTDYSGSDVGGIATYVKEENPNTDHAYYI